MLYPFFALAAQSPTRQRTFRRAAVAHARGTKGYWINLKTGQKIDVPPTYMGGKNEAMFAEGPFKRALPFAQIFA